MSDFDISGYLASVGKLIEPALERRLREGWTALGDGVAPPEAVVAGVLSGGKRVRPILCVAAWQACADAAQSDVPDAVLDLAVSVEFIHAYSLMHDDLPSMDDAPLRRGRATPHTLHGVEATLRGAALLIPVAFWSVWESGLRVGAHATAGVGGAILGDAAGGIGMVGGQAVDLASEGQSITEAALTDLHSRKTGALLAASVELGAWAGGASAPSRQALAAYGRTIGLAFQIADDVLDRTASAADLGKEPSDADLAKSTYVTLLGIEGARAQGRALVDQSLDLLAQADVESPALEGLAEYILTRTR